MELHLAEETDDGGGRGADLLGGDDQTAAAVVTSPPQHGAGMEWGAVAGSQTVQSCIRPPQQQAHHTGVLNISNITMVDCKHSSTSPGSA